MCSGSNKGDRVSKKPAAPLSYERVIDQLIYSVPELAEPYDVEMAWWKEERPGPHVIYGNLLNPYLDRLLQTGDHASLRHVFEFLERLAQSKDTRVQDLVAVTVCEHLVNEMKQLGKAKTFMGPATLKLCADIEKFWGK